MVIGIEYNQQDGNMGFYELRRKAPLAEIAREVGDILANGKSSSPAFPVESNPEIMYAWDVDLWEDGDVYPELMNAIHVQRKIKAA